jgi:hypothetical protein
MATVTLDLPVFDKLLGTFKEQHRRANPEDTRTELLSRLPMLEQPAAFFITGLQIEITSWNQYKANIIGIGFGRNIAPKDDEAFQFACGFEKIIDAEHGISANLLYGFEQFKALGHI